MYYYCDFVLRMQCGCSYHLPLLWQSENPVFLAHEDCHHQAVILILFKVLGKGFRKKCRSSSSGGLESAAAPLL